MKPCRSLPYAAALALVPGLCGAHGYAGAGWLHPLTGMDHMLAMVCVGAWSAQLGKRALILVPAAFMVAMAGGWLLGHAGRWIPGSEIGVALSVVLLGAAIGLERRVSLAMAAAGTALFGICHGYAHGVEMPASQGAAAYAAGFLITTAALHIAGAAVALILLDRAGGRRWMRLAGSLTAMPGLYWLGIALLALR